MTATLTTRGRTWASVAAVGALVAAVAGAWTLTTPAAHEAPTTLKATAERFVEAVNRADWVAVSLFVSQPCQSEAYARAAANADGVLAGTVASLVSADERTGTTVTLVTYPVTGQTGEESTTVWRHEDGRWVAPLDGCDLEPATVLARPAQGERNAVEAMSRLA